MTLNELSAALAARNLIAETQELKIDPGPPANPSPWYVQVMMGACAWFAGILLLAFVVGGLLSFVFHDRDNWTAVLLIGIVACGGAAMLYAAVSEASAFGTQFALAMSFAGQTGIVMGLGGMGGARAALWGMVIVEIALIVLVRNRLHRVLTAAGMVIAWALATHEFLFHELPGVSIWGRAQPAVYQLSVISVLLWIVVWAPVAYGAYWLVRHEAQWMAEGRDSIMRPVAHGVIASLAIAPLATHPATFWMALGLGSTRELTDGSHSASALWPLLAMFLALLALALGYTIRSRPLMGVAIIFGLLEIASFYYVLGATLLIKSIVMVVLGAILLGAARWVAREAQ